MVLIFAGVSCHFSPGGGGGGGGYTAIRLTPDITCKFITIQALLRGETIFHVPQSVVHLICVPKVAKMRYNFIHIFKVFQGGQG